jgi:predicted amidophosphoribosyltransferase
MARVAADVLRRQGRAAEVRAVLRMRARVRDQAGLDAAARAANLSGAVVLPTYLRGLLPSASAEPRGDVVVVLVDDVVTTGSSLAAAATVLAEHDVPVLGAAVVAATARRAPLRPGLSRERGLD